VRSIEALIVLVICRPVKQSAGELRGLLERSSYILSIATTSLSDVSLNETDKPGFRRFIKRVPLGIVFVITPWKYAFATILLDLPLKAFFSYPYLVTINSVLPAIVAGNAVILKPSPQTPFPAERIARALVLAGVPAEVIQVLHLSPELTAYTVQHPQVDFVSFTGSVNGGRQVEEAAVTAKGSFKGVALEVRS
jgi:acyl-CoA reductase-like NAD-dependent aldehyde dehydrogenase